MSFFHRSIAGLRLQVAVAALLLSSLCQLGAQGVSTVQQAQFRSQWIGEQVDLIPLGASATPLNGLGAVVGPLQTQDQVQREVEASFANLTPKSPFSFKPGLGVGWEFSNQGSQTQGTNGSSAAGNSPFVAPSIALLYDRDHGPWSISAGYSAGVKYYSNTNYNGGGTSSQRNPLSQTAFFNAGLQMSRYTFSTTATASSGTGYDFSSGSNNRQISSSVSLMMHYILTSYTTVDATAGMSVQNASQSTATPNNNTGSLYTAVTPTYELSDKTHLSAVIGAGSSTQGLQQGTTTPGNAATTNATSSSLSYAQLLAKVRYDFTAKCSFNLALGARDVTSSQSTTSSSYTGIKPSWTAAFSYTPTPKTSVNLSLGEQGSDVVPELSLGLSWKPREKTQVSIALTQTQTYASTLNSQYQVSTGIIGTLNQKLFSSVDLNVNAGYTQQRFVNLASSQSSGLSGQTSSQLPGSMYLGQLNLNWRIRDWVSLANTLTYSTGQNQSVGQSASTQPQIWYAISLNFAL